MPAIERMAHKSALGQWYAAQILVTSGIPIDEVSRLNFAASKVRDKILDGALEIRGGIHNQYNAIPRTEWRTAILGFFPDRMALWKMRVTPGGMVTMESDGSVHTDVDQDTIAHLLQFDSLLVDSYQFEDLWPRVESVADKERRQFLKEARKRHLDQDTIKDLS